MNELDNKIIDSLGRCFSDYQGRVNSNAEAEIDAWIMHMAAKAGPIRPGLHTTFAYQGLTEFPD